MMKYTKLKTNDIANGEGVCVSLWVQGCPHHCPGCFNPETWDFNGGQPVPSELKGEIAYALTANGIKRNFSVLGGEPLCPENLYFVYDIIRFVRYNFPDIKIYVWTGYLYEDLISRKDEFLDYILDNINYLIDGPFQQEKKDLTLKLRGSSNQRILSLKDPEFKPVTTTT